MTLSKVVPWCNLTSSIYAEIQFIFGIKWLNNFFFLNIPYPTILTKHNMVRCSRYNGFSARRSSLLMPDYFLRLKLQSSKCCKNVCMLEVQVLIVNSIMQHNTHIFLCVFCAHHAVLLPATVVFEVRCWLYLEVQVMFITYNMMVLNGAVCVRSSTLPMSFYFQSVFLFFTISSML